MKINYAHLFIYNHYLSVTLAILIEFFPSVPRHNVRAQLIYTGHKPTLKGSVWKTRQSRNKIDFSFAGLLPSQRC